MKEYNNKIIKYAKIEVPTLSGDGAGTIHSKLKRKKKVQATVGSLNDNLVG